MQPKTYTVSADRHPEAMRIFKPTILFLAFLVSLITAYIYHWRESIELKYDQVKAGEIWRLWSNLIGSYNFNELASNVLSLVLLTIISERTKGTIAWILDAFLKSGLINLLSFLLYLALGWLESELNYGFLTFLVQMQNGTSNFGLKYLVVAELFSLLSRTQFNWANNRPVGSYSFLFQIFIAFYFVILCCVYFRYFGVVCAIFVAVIFQLLDFENRLMTSNIVDWFERRIGLLSFGIYLANKKDDNKTTASHFEHIRVNSSNSKSLSDSSKDEYQELNSAKEKSLNKEDFSHDKSKSRGPYDEVIINDFILEPPNNTSVNPKDDNSSFAI
jgi:hypothetical protein